MIDFRKSKQYISYCGETIYIYLYKQKNYIAYGINGTSIHFTINDYKSKTKNEILQEIITTIHKELCLWKMI